MVRWFDEGVGVFMWVGSGMRDSDACGEFESLE
jgi:hypothetical protein